MTDLLFPAKQQRLQVDQVLDVSLAEAIEQTTRGSVVPTFNLHNFRRELAGYTFGSPRGLEESITWVIRQLQTGVVHVNHPRYFGLFNPDPTFPSQCADRIVAAFNPQLATWTTSPAAVEIEAHVIAAVANRLGMRPEARGQFTSGGTEANFTAMVLALTKANARFGTDGARAFAGQPFFYVSQDSHLAWLKIAHQAGVGRAAVRFVPTDGTGMLDLDVLISTIEDDRARGGVPFMLVATAGTTNAGMIDPLPRCADIARKFGLWYHVDAAWGGGLVASDCFRARLGGIERADSMTIDAHKWFATTMGCGMFITAHPSLLSSAFQVSTTYMPSNLVDADPYVTSVQWSRRFVGLRLFLVLASTGWRGYAEHVERSLALLELLRAEITAQGWIIANASPAGVLCMIPPGGDAVPAIVHHVQRSGTAWVSVAKFEGRQVIRACVTSGATTPQDVADLVGVLVQADNTIRQEKRDHG